MRTFTVQDVEDSLVRLSEQIASDADRYGAMFESFSELEQGVRFLMGLLPKPSGDPCTHCKGTGVEPGT
jgi:hypothetical protein